MEEFLETSAFPLEVFWSVQGVERILRQAVQKESLKPIITIIAIINADLDLTLIS